MMRKKGTQEKRLFHSGSRDEDSGDIDTTEWEPPKKRMKREFTATDSSPYFTLQENATPSTVIVNSPRAPRKAPKKPKSDLDILCEMAEVLYKLEVKPYLPKESTEDIDESSGVTGGEEFVEEDAQVEESSDQEQPQERDQDEDSSAEPLSLLTSAAQDQPPSKTELQQKLHQHQLRSQEQQRQAQQSQQSQFHIQNYTHSKPPSKPELHIYECKPYVSTLQKFNYPQQEYFHTFYPYTQQSSAAAASQQSQFQIQGPSKQPAQPQSVAEQPQQPKVQQFQQRLQFHQSYPYHFNKEVTGGRKEGATPSQTSNPTPSTSKNVSFSMKPTLR